jgi:hypothetical protein
VGPEDAPSIIAPGEDVVEAPGYFNSRFPRQLANLNLANINISSLTPFYFLVNSNISSLTPF